MNDQIISPEFLADMAQASAKPGRLRELVRRELPNLTEPELAAAVAGLKPLIDAFLGGSGTMPAQGHAPEAYSIHDPLRQQTEAFLAAMRTHVETTGTRIPLAPWLALAVVHLSQGLSAGPGATSATARRLSEAMGTSERTAWRRINEVRAALARGFKAPEPEPAASWESVAYRTVLGEDGRHYRFVVRNGEAVEPMDKCEECGRALPAWSRNGRPPGRVCRPCRDKRRRSK